METRKKDLTHVKYVVYDEEVFLVPPADATEIALFGPTCLKKEDSGVFLWAGRELSSPPSLPICKDQEAILASCLRNLLRHIIPLRIGFGPLPVTII